MNENEKLSVILDSLKSGYDLSVYDFVKDTAIIKDENNIMFNCDVLFYDSKAFFINIKQKNENCLLATDIA